MSDTRQHEKEIKDRGERAFILVSIIWITGLLAVIASAFAINIRVQILSGANQIQTAKAELLSDGLVYLTAWKLAVETDSSNKNIPRNGVPWICQWSADAEARIAVQDQGGLVDLNAAPMALLVKVLESTGLPEAPASKLASSIEDYRDSDSDATEGGSEPEAYEDVSFGPKNAPFQAVEEIDQLPGMNDEIYGRLLPILTVHSLQPGFDPTLLPLGLKMLLRVTDNGEAPPELAPFAVPSNGGVFGLDVTVSLRNGTAFRRQATITVLRQPDRPFTILAWQRGAKPDQSFGAADRKKSTCFN